MRALPALLLLCLCLLGPVPGHAEPPLKATLLLEHGEPTPWNELLRTGLDKAAREFGIDATVVIAPRSADQTAIFRNAAASSDLVIVASDSLHEVLRDNAGNFRRVMFGCVDAGIRGPNIMCVTFADEQAAFLAGAFAALFSRETGVQGINGEQTIGWLSGEDTPAMRTLYNGFYEGAQLASPGTRVIQALTGSFSDGATAASKAAALLDTGADVIALAAGAGNAAAAAEIAARKAWFIELDQWRPATRAAGAIVKQADRAVYEIAAAAARGQFKGKEIMVYDLANQGSAFTGMDGVLKQPGISPTPARRIQEITREMRQGTIRTRSLRARTLCDCLD